MLNVTDHEIEQAVQNAQRHIYDPNTPIQDAAELVTIISNIATKATIKLLRHELGSENNAIDDFSPFPIVFAEWAQQYAIKTHYDRFLAIMNYLREQENVSRATTSDIAKMYDRARWKKPANLADVFAKGAERILFAEAEVESEDGLKLWQMTRTGYEHLINLKVED